MRKLIMGLLVAGIMGLFSVKAFAGLVEGRALLDAGKYAEAEAEYRKSLLTLTGEDAVSAQFYTGHCLELQKKYVEAIVEYAKVKDVAGVSSDFPGNAQYRIGYCLELQKKYNEAIVEYAKVKDIVDASPTWLASAQFRVGYCLELQKKYAEAIVGYIKVKNIVDVTPDWLAVAQLRIGCCLEGQDKTAEAQEAYLLVCNKGGDLYCFKQALDKIDPTIVGVPKYLAYLNKLLLIVPAKAENAEFLGFVKSEIEKLKLK